MRPFSTTFALLVVALALAFAGCGDDAAETTDTADKPPAGTTPGIGDTRDCPDSKKQPTFDVTVIYGVSEVKAEEIVKENGYSMRAIFVDGEPRPATTDYNPKRLNVAVREGTVTQLCSVG